MNKIEVNIKDSALSEVNPHFVEMTTIQILRNAGIPIKGLFVFDGFERPGILTVTVNEDDYSTKYVWEEEGS